MIFLGRILSIIEDILGLAQSLVQLLLELMPIIFELMTLILAVVALHFLIMIKSTRSGCNFLCQIQILCRVLWALLLDSYDL